MSSAVRIVTDDANIKFDEHDRRFCENIEEYGFAVSHILDDEDGPCFTYTTGFWKEFRHPEIILFGLDNEVSGQMLWNVFEILKQGEFFENGSVSSEILNNCDCHFVSLLKSNRKKRLTWSDWYYCREPFPALQMVWPDKSGRYPWDSGVQEEFLLQQPLMNRDG